MEGKEQEANPNVGYKVRLHIPIVWSEDGGVRESSWSLKGGDVSVRERTDFINRIVKKMLGFEILKDFNISWGPCAFFSHFNHLSFAGIETEKKEIERTFFLGWSEDLKATKLPKYRALKW